ncbi:L-ascorbate metabolism protein UlaG, beta-lactamase superfamily [Maribacter orientalis]|uniref:L-ascorbate metabolism protein UlaG, beta-lactamase superfamily n=1 Tax=Maribacter orientalis TaxID=228957 RepID=A0A1H7SRX8_9FLAO|nr:MBL fold metallo-hydrolase [Maribacter orientalis]SEL74816.1 L-ascorbate metabolism protein UlaG, beta-lactamase superfamily [Maribacter orientalis]
MKKKKLFVLLLTFSLSFACKDAKKSEKEIDSTSDNVEETADASKILKMKGDEIKITPIEHATAVIEWNDITIYIDPTGGSTAFKNQKKPDLILITDIHGDHFNKETLEAIDISKATFVVPQAVADEMPNEFADKLKILSNGSSKELNGILIEAIPMYNLREEAKDFHVKGRGNGYILTIDKQRIYFSGDTEDIPEMRSLKNIDKAFVCMNLPYTMTVESAASAVLDFKPKQVFPYHYRGRPDVSDVEMFKKLVDAGNQDIEVVQLDWYPNEDY